MSGRRVGTGGVVRNEVAKLRHLRVGLVAGLMVLGMVALTLLSTLTSAVFADPARRSWDVPLAGLSLAVPLVCPLLLALVASRMVDVEHQGGGWLLNATSGTTPGVLCRAKLVTGAGVVVVVTAVTHLSVWALGRLAGIDAPVPVGLWLGFAAAGLAVNLVVLALHVVLSATVDNQLVALGTGLLGTVVAVFGSGFPAWSAHLTPWGYYSLVAAAGYEGQDLVRTSPSCFSVLVLTVTAAALFGLVTSRFDRQETR
ncbi:ABC transporter permease [Auraticoccus sp. F435]|uniref:ABC transporter permease n=1 Tax=Auraticoccus cholistanensis TaxID=2656650 RepID=A0A6A9US37_9ACTN|nr:ABC transporter permease [Auraticoccus cholistanensis]